MEKGKEVPNQETLLKIIKDERSRMKRAFFSVMYLTAGRINEIVPCRRARKKKSIKKTFIRHDGREYVEKIGEDRWWENVNYDGMTKNNIKFVSENSKEVMILTLRNEKNRLREVKRLPISVEKEGQFVEIVKDYIDALGEDNVLFNFSSVTGWKYIKKAFGFNPHFMRHIRLTHLVQLFNYDHILLMKFAGWSNTKQADRYLQLSWKDLLRGMG